MEPSYWNQTILNISLQTIDVPCSEIDKIINAYYVPTIYSCTFILGATLNFAAIIVYLFALKKWTRSNIFLFNLLLADLLYICNLPFLISYYANKGIWYFGEFYCKLVRYFFHATLYTSILFLGCVSMDRYFLIAHPVKSAEIFKKWHAALISLTIWIVVTLELLPMFYLITTESISNSTELKCLDYASSGDVEMTFIFSMTLTFTGFFIPYCILVFSYILVARVLNDMKRRFQHSDKVGKPLTLIVFAMALFSASFIPYHIMRNARIAVRMFYTSNSCPTIIFRALYNATRPFSSLNSCLNPVFYFLVGDKFRDKLFSLLCKRQKSSCKNLTRVSKSKEITEVSHL
ncbi:succinate receptor 1-like [Erpetoichthys calabaricus]|uniref:succinate receptor 1-like n=1 Tax=Erpetoichthys calabaricus TaxID=27687 RepID=UPI002233F303|nr:succinate receptor 1-like [Erpetoichthys calabaricus]